MHEVGKCFLRQRTRNITTQSLISHTSESTYVSAVQTSKRWCDLGCGGERCDGVDDVLGDTLGNCCGSFPTHCYPNPNFRPGFFPTLCDNSIGYIVGKFSTIAKTTDNGVTWSMVDNIEYVYNSAARGAHINAVVVRVKPCTTSVRSDWAWEDGSNPWAAVES